MVKRVLLNRGVYFNGQNAYIEVDDNPVLQVTDQVTMVTWCKPHNLPTNIFVDIVKRSYWTGETDAGYLLRFDSNWLPVVICGNEDTGWWGRLKASNPVEMGREYLIAGGYDGSKLFLFVNGDWYTLDDPGQTIKCTNQPFKINANRKFQGISYSVWLYNRALTVDELWQLYQYPDKPPTDGLILWLPFTENMGVVAKDFSGNNNHARLYNCKWVSRARRGMYFDNGGIKFDSGLNIDCNYCSVVAVFAIETLARGGSIFAGRNCIVRSSGDKLMLFNSHPDKKLRFTNYDGAWKEVKSNIDLEAGQVYTAAGVMNSNEEHIYLASNGVIIDHNYRDDLGDCGEYTNTPIYVGSRGSGTYPLHGEVLAVMTYDRPISESKIERISDLGWFDPPRDGLISWILFDGLKEGDTPVDKITGAVGKPIGTPKFVIRKPKRVLVR